MIKFIFSTLIHIFVYGKAIAFIQKTQKAEEWEISLTCMKPRGISYVEWWWCPNTKKT